MTRRTELPQHKGSAWHICFQQYRTHEQDYLSGMDTAHTVAIAQMGVWGRVRWQKHHLVRQKFPLLLWKWVKAPSLLSMGNRDLACEVRLVTSFLPPLKSPCGTSSLSLFYLWKACEEALGLSLADLHSSSACVTQAFTTSVRKPFPLLLMGNNKACKSGFSHLLQNCKISHT